MPEHFEVSTIAIGRHSDLDEDASDSSWVTDETCTSAVKKEVLISADSAEPTLYVQTVCDECGTVARGEFLPDDVQFEVDDDE